MADSSATPPSREHIDRYLAGMYAPLAMLAGMQLDLFSPLENGPRTPQDLAAAVGVENADKLAILLRALVCAGLLIEEGGAFANTPESDAYLVRGRRAFLGDTHLLLSDIWTAVFKTAETLRAGKPQHKHDFHAMSEGELHDFLRGLHAGALASGRGLQKLFDFSGYRSMLDVAGGSGAVSIALCEGNPELTSTVVDLPTVTPLTARFVEEAGMSGRIGVDTQNVLAAPLKGQYDVVVMRAFMQVLSPADAAQALKNVAPAVKPGGDLYILGRVLDDSRMAPASSVNFNMVFLNVYEDGCAHTEGEHRQWLAAAGFAEVNIRTLPDGIRIVSARKP